MPQNVLGLDLGSYSIKAALFETTFRSFVLTDLFESSPLQLDELEGSEKAVVIKEALLRILQENHLHPSTVVTAIPGTQVSTRILSLPLPEKQVGKVLPFELESHLPFDLENIVLDHHVISSSKTETKCLAAAIQKATLAEHLGILREVGLDPAFVTLDSLSLSNLQDQMLKEPGESYALVDIGHQKTSICIVANGTARYVRTLFTGGQGITNHIREALDLTLSQAAEVKHNHGIIELETHPLRSEDLRRLSGAIRKALDPFIQELLQTFHSYRVQFSQPDSPEVSLNKVFLCGGTSLIRNLPEYISSLTHLTVTRLSLLPQETPGAEAKAQRESVFGQAIALGLRAAARGSSAKKVALLNFRRSEFSFAKDLTGLKQKAFFFGKWITVIFLVALLQVGLKYPKLAREKSQVDRMVLREFREMIPEMKNPPKSSSAKLQLIKKRIGEYQQKQEILTAGLKEMTALGVLREISLRIPSDIKLDTQELAIDRNKVSLRGNVDSFEAVDRIIAGLRNQPEFRDIERGDIRESPDGKKAFVLTFKIGEETPKPGRKK